MNAIDLCVAGACGRMGRLVIREALVQGFNVCGAIEAHDNPLVGKTLEEAGICFSDLIIADCENMADALDRSDVYVSFTNPEAETKNMQKVARSVKRIVMGTTGFSSDQKKTVEDAIGENKAMAVISPNFSLGVNVLYEMLSLVDFFPEDYDAGICEIHHLQKQDAPSGTALKMAEIISQKKGYSKHVYGRSGRSRRNREEMEVVSLRAGSVPGIHEAIIAGADEMVRLEHFVFSPRVFAVGALEASRFLFGKKLEEGRIFGMKDVIESRK